MIVFDMSCSKGHTFEGWFDNIESFEDQNSKGQVSCPYCDDTNIRKVLSPVAVKRSTSNKQTLPMNIDYQKLAKEIIDNINKNTEDVGPKFAAEALKIHYGVTETRNIRGTTSPEEENILKEEGVAFFKFPVLKTDDDKKN